MIEPELNQNNDYQKNLMDVVYHAPFPHCDPTVLHAPGECEHCDHYPTLQRVRTNNAIRFSGEGGSPDEKRRPRATIDAWGSNRAIPKTCSPHGENSVFSEQADQSSPSEVVCPSCREVTADHCPCADNSGVCPHVEDHHVGRHALPKTPFEKVVDDLTGGCGCACHAGTGYRTTCEHCLYGHLPIVVKWWPTQTINIDLDYSEFDLDLLDFDELFNTLCDAVFGHLEKHRGDEPVRVLLERWNSNNDLVESCEGDAPEKFN